MTQLIELEGEVTGVVWRNPHVRFELMGRNGDGEAVSWDVESIPVTRLTRMGITQDVLKVGDSVMIAGYPARRAGNAAYAINLLLADGREALLDTPTARWKPDNFIGTGLDGTPGTAGADGSLGIYRVWSTDGSFLSTETRFLTEGGTLSYPLQAAAREALAAFDPLDPDNPFRTCMPKGMPLIMQQPNPVEFVQGGDVIHFNIEEFDTRRRIAMTEATSTQGEPPNLLGHSVGRWEGGTLVVETTGIDYPYFDQTGLPQSEAIETVERFTLNDDGSRLDYELVVTDPWLFTEPVTLSKSWRWVPGDRVLPFDCTLEG